MTAGNREEIERILEQAGDIESEIDSRILTEELNAEALEDAVRRRASGEPLAYILGHRHFYREDYRVVPGVLIPRSDSELLVECALQYLGHLDMPIGDVAKIKSSGITESVRFADLCTGTGCIGISLANELKRRGTSVSGILTDISDTALKVAKENVSRCCSCPESVEVIRHDILADPLGGSFCIIVSNPPYVTDSEMRELDREVSEYEPHLALEGGADGLRFYGTILAKAYAALIPGGAVMVEHGYLQGEAVRKLCEKAGFEGIMTLKDYGGNDRVTAGFKHAG